LTSDPSLPVGLAEWLLSLPGAWLSAASSLPAPPLLQAAAVTASATEVNTVNDFLVINFMVCLPLLFDYALIVKFNKFS
jgi:hypothetical protein